MGDRDETKRAVARGVDLKAELDMALQNASSARIGPERLTTGETKILNQIVESCPTCECPERCEAELNVISPTRGWDGWDEYCPNAARLRVLAALSMFTARGADH